MPLLLLLLLVLLRAASSLGLQLSETPGRGDEDDWEGYDDGYVTDPPETLETTPGALTPRPELRAAAGTLGPRDSTGPGAPEPAPPAVTAGDAAGLDAGGATSEKLSVAVATEGIPVTPGPLTTEQGPTLPPITEAPSTAGAPSTELATTEALPTEPRTTQPAATEAPTPSPAATEALTTEPRATPPAATEALTTEPPTTTAAPPPAPTTTGTPSEEPATVKALSTGALSTAPLVLSDPHGGATAAVPDSSDASIRRGKSSQGLSPPGSSPAAPTPTRGPEYMPVKHCLLAILILALVATTFLVCTVVLAVRLSRRNHMYHVRSYSPTEMVCISALLPEGGEGAAASANGSLPAAVARGPGLQEGHSGDDLTLQSFLP